MDIYEFNELFKQAYPTLCIIFGYFLVRLVFASIVKRKITDPINRQRWLHILNYAALFLFVTFLAMAWFDWFRSATTFLGIIAAAIVIVNKELLANIFAWSIIIWRDMFSIGDRIKVNGSEGQVTKIGLLYITILEYSGDVTGSVIKIPNASILTHPVVNYSKSARHIWHKFEFEADYQNWKAIYDECEKWLKENVSFEIKNRHKLISHGTEAVFDSISPTVQVIPSKETVTFKVRFLCYHGTENKLQAEMAKYLLENVGSHIAGTSKG